MDKQRILVADDEPDMIRIISRSLTLEGFEVVVADNGDECFAKVLSYEPELVLLDILMPGKSGIEVLKALKSQPETQDVPVLMLTALWETGYIDEAMKNGAEDYVVKPFEHEFLLTKIRHAMDHRESVSTR